MRIVLIILCLAMIGMGWVLSLSIYKKWFNPMSFMNGLWFFITFFSVFSLWGFKEVSAETYLLLGIGISFFNIGACIPTRKSRFVSDFQIVTLYQDPILIKRMRVYNIVLAFSSVSELLNVSYYYIASYDTAYIRGVYFQGSLKYVIGTKEFWELFRSYISQPLLITVIIISVIWFVEYRNWKQITLSVVYVLAYLAVSYSRFIILYLLVALIFVFAVSKRYVTNLEYYLRIVKKCINRLLIVGVVAILGVSLFRGVQKFLISIYEYFCGCIFLLDQLLDELPNKFTYGVLSFKGIIAPTYTVLHKLFRVPYTTSYYTALNIYDMKEKAHVISSSGQVTNAFGTPVFSLFADGGYFGVALGMLLFGFISTYIYRRMTNELNEKNIALYVVVIICIVKSIQEYPFSSSLFIFPLIFIFLLYRGVVFSNESSIKA